MSNYYDYFLNSNSSVIHIELLEISHSAFTQTYRIVRNMTSGVTVTTEEAEDHFFQYYPLKVTPLSSNDDLDQAIKITLGDLGEILPKELDNIFNDLNFTEKPTVKYRVYRSDDLTQPLVGPLLLEVQTFNFNKEGSVFEAKAPSLNVNTTGELYNLTRFPMLRGFL
ncbi:DUF1833 domain-containing protein [Candidatus Dependentiae bacterium]|nr:MAG: DUF1833 domain-containing protein [Candidatus Dependentiae bacterium]